MPLDYITQQQAHQHLIELFRTQGDTGVRPYAEGALLEPANPFKPEARRKFKLSVLFFGSLAGSGMLGFILFTIFR